MTIECVWAITTAMLIIHFKEKSSWINVLFVFPEKLILDKMTFNLTFKSDK